MLSYTERVALARRFYTVLAHGDWSSLRGLVADDAQWIVPGNNTISGPVEGGDAVITRFRQIADYGLTFTLEHVLVSRTDVALGLHSTAERDGRTLDERLTTVCRIRDGKIVLIETFLSDVEKMDAFFV
jgi:ketosteroid isomerase-like protein